jgi:hypothetical protein
LQARAKLAYRNAGWQPRSRGRAAVVAAQRVELVLLHAGCHLGDVDDLVTVGIRVGAGERLAAFPARTGFENLQARDLSGWNQHSGMSLVPWLPTALSPCALRSSWGGGAPGGSVDGGLDELPENWASRASSSRTRRSSASMIPCSFSMIPCCLRTRARS